MDYSFLNKHEYNDIPIIRIADNRNNLPFFIIKMDRCNRIKHRHEFVQIIYVLKGKLKHVLNDNVFDVYKGDIFVIPPFVPHYFIDEYEKGFEIIEFEFVPEFIHEKFSSNVRDNSFMDFAYLEPFLVAEQELKPRLNITGSLQLEVEKILEEVIKEYENRESDFELLVKAQLLKLLVLVGREFKKNIEGSESQGIFDRHRDALYNAINFVNEHLAEDISLDDVAKVAMLSSSYFRYLFKQMTEKTFVEYLNHLRINKAVELLKNEPAMKVIEVCYKVGYNNVNHFNRIFRQVTGLSPSAYRKH
jgi:AraC-like DNA-binding protein/mannose-6-phosphate isomerase-like protein (cupin superfamily)